MKRKLKLYLLTNKDPKCQGYDTYDSIVVAAYTAAKARQIGPRGHLSLKSHSGSWPNGTQHVESEFIGYASNKLTDGEVVLASFNAG